MKSNCTIKLCKLYGLDQSISQVYSLEQNCSSSGFSSVPKVHALLLGSSWHLKLGSFSRKANASRKNIAPILVKVFIMQETNWNFPKPPQIWKASSTVTYSLSKLSLRNECYCWMSALRSGLSSFLFESSLLGKLIRSRASGAWLGSLLTDIFWFK